MIKIKTQIKLKKRKNDTLFEVKQAVGDFPTACFIIISHTDSTNVPELKKKASMQLTMDAF